MILLPRWAVTSCHNLSLKPMSQGPDEREMAQPNAPQPGGEHDKDLGLEFTIRFPPINLDSNSIGPVKYGSQSSLLAVVPAGT